MTHRVAISARLALAIDRNMYFIAQLEETYEIELTGDEIADMRTIGDIKKVILSKGKQA